MIKYFQREKTFAHSGFYEVIIGYWIQQTENFVRLNYFVFFRWGVLAAKIRSDVVFLNDLAIIYLNYILSLVWEFWHDFSFYNAIGPYKLDFGFFFINQQKTKDCSEYNYKRINWPILYIQIKNQQLNNNTFSEFNSSLNMLTLPTNRILSERYTTQFSSFLFDFNSHSLWTSYKKNVAG